jgi:hypothetical protein
MKKILFALMLIPILFAAPAVLAQQPAPHGLGASALLGMNMCLSHGDAECDNIDPSFGFSGGALYRFLDFLAVDANFYYGLYGVDGGDASSLGFVVGPRGFLNLGNIDLSLGFGLGWGQTSGSRGGGEYKVSGLQVGLSVGAEYLLMQNFGIGLLGRFFLPAFNTACATIGGVETCGDVNDDLSYEMMFGLNATYYFGL